MLLITYHDEEPGLEDFAGVDIGQQRTGAEINLNGFGGFEVQTQRNVGILQGIQLREKSIHRGIAAGVTVVTRERGMDGGALDAGTMPLADLLTPRFQCG